MARVGKYIQFHGEILSSYQNGESCSSIGKRLGIHGKQVNRIIKRLGGKIRKYNGWSKGKYIQNKKTKNKMSVWQINKTKPYFKGSKNPNWKGGITNINRLIRGSIEYSLWREAVFKRDNFTCIWCGKKGGNLEVDHIKQFAYYPELRFAIDNGRTLCKDCHKTTETYSKKL